MAHFVAGLAHAGKDDLAGVAACSQDTRQLSAGYDVEAGTELREYGQDAEVGVGFDCVTDQRAATCERLLPGIEGSGERGFRIDVAGCAELFGDLRQCQSFEAQGAVQAVQGRRWIGAEGFLRGGHWIEEGWIRSGG